MFPPTSRLRATVVFVIIAQLSELYSQHYLEERCARDESFREEMGPSSMHSTVAP